MDMKGKVAIVTGGTKGIGLAVAQDLAGAGASVMICARTGDEVSRVAAELDEAHPGEVRGVPCDVSDPTSCAELVAATVEAFGGVNVLVNNAGLGVFKPIQEMSVEEWQLQIDVNLGGVFYCTKAALPHLMEAEDAWIINIGSLASRNSFSGGAGYNASKFGLLGMTEAIMLDVRHSGIRTSIIMPGSVDTWFNGREPSPEGAWKIQAGDVAQEVMNLLRHPGNSLPSRIEMRPSKPPRS